MDKHINNLSITKCSFSEKEILEGVNMDNCPFDEFELKLLIDACEKEASKHQALGMNDMKIRHYPILKGKLERILSERKKQFNKRLEGMK